MELKHISKIEEATKPSSGELFRFGMGMLFIIGVMLFASARGIDGQFNAMLVAAAVVGGYMALNIGANDVANNVGPAVGSKAMTLGLALVIAAVFEAAGALIAGGEVVGTIRKGIIDASMLPRGETFIWLMLAALLAGAMWLNIATAVGAPVSTTHSIVGAVLGAGIAASGFDVANWGKVGQIVASWVISPVMGGLIAAGFLYLIKHRITYTADMRKAALKWVPLLIAIMGWTSATYLMLKGLKAIWKVSFGEAVVYGLVVAIALFLVVRPMIARQAAKLPNDKSGIKSLFTVPLIFAAALLSFAHGSNDVANAVGPLAAIVDALGSLDGEIHAKASIPMWVMMIGAIGISFGLALYGPKVIKTVGSEITELDQTRAYCIAMAATITVIIASQLGLPVSSTHIAVGGVFGVGFLREWIKRKYARIEDEIKAHHPEGDQAAIDAFMERFNKAPVAEKGAMLNELKAQAKAQLDPAHFSKQERKALKQVYRYELVKRSQLMRIAAAWVITVPASALMAALLFYMIRGMMLP